MMRDRSFPGWTKYPANNHRHPKPRKRIDGNYIAVLCAFTGILLIVFGIIGGRV
jgi:hypothetical protein